MFVQRHRLSWHVDDLCIWLTHRHISFRYFAPFVPRWRPVITQTCGKVTYIFNPLYRYMILFLTGLDQIPRTITQRTCVRMDRKKPHNTLSRVKSSNAGREPLLASPLPLTLRYCISSSNSSPICQLQPQM